MKPTMNQTPKPGTTAVMAYKQTSYYKWINHYLRTKSHVDGILPYQRDNVTKYIEQIHSLMSKGFDSSKYPQLYRGTDCLEFGVLRETALPDKVNQLYTWRSFVSVSTSLRQAKKFIKDVNGTGVLIVFRPSAERTRFLNIKDYSNMVKHNQENEILLDYGTTGTIREVTEIKNGGTSYTQVTVDL